MIHRLVSLPHELLGLEISADVKIFELMTLKPHSSTGRFDQMECVCARVCVRSSVADRTQQPSLSR